MDTLILQKTMRTLLGAWQPLAELVGTRIFDNPPAARTSLPCVVIGPTQGIDQTLVECVIDWEVIQQLDIYSRDVGFPECKRIARACDDALASLDALAGMRFGWFRPLGQRFVRDPDGLTSHGIAEYRARYGPA